MNRCFRCRLIWCGLVIGVFSSAATTSAVDIGIVNGNFELDGADNVAPPTGWIDNSSATSFWTGIAGEGGNPSVAQGDLAPPPGLGSYFLTTARTSAGIGSQPTDGQLVQTVDLSTFGTQIDTGNQFLFVDFIWASNDSRDTGVFSMSFFDTPDGTGTELGAGYSIPLDANDGFNFVGWFEESVGGGVPASTRSVTLSIDTTRTGGSETNLWFDNFVGDITDTPVIINEWDVDGGGSFNTATNWLTDEVPTNDAIFGSILTEPNAPATVTIDSPISLNSVTFANSNRYILAGPETLTLAGDSTISATAIHEIAAEIAGNSGLVKTNGGTLVLPNANSYTGTTDVQVGTLDINNLDAIDNQVSGTVNIESTGTLLISAGASGSLDAQLTGSGLVNLADSLEPTDTIIVSGSNSTFSGLIRVDDGTLVVANNNALGAGGSPSNRTTLDDDSTAKVALPGGVSVADELLDMDGRSTDAVGLTSSGNNAWNGVIDGQGNAGQLARFNIESTSGTLTLNELFASDVDAPQTFVFSGAGNTTIIGRLAEDAYDDVSGSVVPSAFDNVGVVKRGSGTLTIDIGANGGGGRIDYWFGPTSIEGGSLVVNAAAGDVGELRSLDINIKTAAILNVSSFGTYSQQIGQIFRGSGEIVAGTLALFDDGSLAPGDEAGMAGTLNVTGNVTLTAVDTGGVWSFDIGNNTDPSGDVLAVSNSFTASGSPSLTVNVTPFHGHLDAGNRTIITHAGGTNASVNGMTAQVTDADGNPLNTRQTVAINGDTAGQVNVVVSGEEASRTWNGNLNGKWDVATTNNWQEGDQQFKDLDQVTFDDTATGTTDVVLEGPRYAGSVTFNNNSKAYTFNGGGGLVGTGDVNVNSGTVEFRNSGNNYSGTTTVSASSTLQFSSSATTGDIVNAGNLSVGSPSVSGGNPVSIANSGFESDAAPMLGATGWTITSGGTDWFTTTAGQPDSVLDPVAAAEGVNWLSGNRLATGAASSSNPQVVSQLVDISAESALVDAGTAHLNLEFQFADNDPNDEATVTIAFFSDVAGTVPVGTPLTSGVIAQTPDGNQNTPAEWAYRNLAGIVPASARSFEVVIENTRLGGTSAGNVHFDDFNATVRNGSFGGSASLDVDGDLTLMDGSTLELFVQSTSSFSEVLVDGLFTADGTLQLTELAGAMFSEGDIFDVLDFDTAAGSFDNLVLPTLAAGLGWDASNLMLTGELAVVAAGLAGDFNDDGVVNLADYTVWRNNLGADEDVLPSGSGDGSGTVDAGDYTAWKLNFGMSNSASLSSNLPAAVPEPSSWILFGILGIALTAYRRIRCQL